MFSHDLIELPKLERLDGGIRHYMTPTGEKYPSVTTVLDKTSDKTTLIKWRQRVGNEEADRITTRAATRGTNIHTLCERLVLNQPLQLNEEPAVTIDMFNQLREQLITNVSDIRLSEGSLFSHKLKVAGSVDLVAKWRGKPAIIDFKTSRKRKRREWIENYFLQASMYSFMLWEMTGIYHPDIVILIAVEEENEPQVFTDKAANWIDLARIKCKAYHTVYSV